MTAEGWITFLGWSEPELTTTDTSNHLKSRSLCRRCFCCNYPELFSSLFLLFLNVNCWIYIVTLTLFSKCFRGWICLCEFIKVNCFILKVTSFEFSFLVMLVTCSDDLPLGRSGYQSLLRTPYLCIVFASVRSFSCHYCTCAFYSRQ